MSTDDRTVVVGVDGDEPGWRDLAWASEEVAAARGRLAAHARCPVVVARPVRGQGGLFAGHVVVGVDGSAPARAALAFGFGFAETHGLPLAAVHAAGTHHDDQPGDVWVDDTFGETHL